MNPQDEQFFENILSRITNNDYYNQCLLTGQTKKDGYFMCIHGMYQTYSYCNRGHLQWKPLLFYTLTEYINTNLSRFINPNVYLIIYHDDYYLHIDCGIWIGDKDLGKKVVKQSNYFYALISHDGEDISD